MTIVLKHYRSMFVMNTTSLLFVISTSEAFRLGRISISVAGARTSSIGTSIYSGCDMWFRLS